jgi:hypothetical protein
MDGLCQQLEPLARRVAVAAACGTALVALLFDVPVWVACARGLGSLVCVTVAARLGLLALERAAAAEAADAQPASVRVTRSSEE